MHNLPEYYTTVEKDVGQEKYPFPAYASFHTFDIFRSRAALLVLDYVLTISPTLIHT